MQAQGDKNILFWIKLSEAVLVFYWSYNKIPQIQ